MTNGEHVPPPEAVAPGQQLATEMLTALVISNENAKLTHELLGEIASELAELNSNFAAVNDAFDELAEISQDKGKLSMSDVAQCFARAFAEAFEEEEAPPGQPD